MIIVCYTITLLSYIVQRCSNKTKNKALSEEKLDHVISERFLLSNNLRSLYNYCTVYKYTLNYFLYTQEIGDKINTYPILSLRQN